MASNTSLLVGYGTLLHKGSLGQSIGHSSASSKDAVPVIVCGYRRLFNLRPDHYSSSFKLGNEPIENGAMNVEEAPDMEFNGLAFTVTGGELEALDVRERYYERRSVQTYAFPSREPLGVAFAYVCPVDSPWIERDTSRLMPLWRDIVWARAGAYRVSDQFGVFYDRTTYLADGKTLMIEVYRSHLKDTGDVELPK